MELPMFRRDVIFLPGGVQPLFLFFEHLVHGAACNTVFHTNIRRCSVRVLDGIFANFLLFSTEQVFLWPFVGGYR